MGDLGDLILRGAGGAFQVLALFYYVELCKGLIDPSKRFANYSDALFWSWKRHGIYYFHIAKYSPLIALVLAYAGGGGNCDFEGACAPSGASEALPPDEQLAHFIKLTEIMLIASFYAGKVRLRQFIDAGGK